MAEQKVAMEETTTQQRPTRQGSPGNPWPDESEYQLPIYGFEGTPEEIERQWYEKAYRGRGDTLPQLTLRAVLMGALLGGFLSLTNLYIGLKAGWGFGVAITACILSYAIWTGLYNMGIAKSQMSVLENNCMQSTASAAGYSTGSTLVSAFAAYILLNGKALPFGLTLAWVFFVAVLGVTMAIPMKRQMINIEQLRFPSGIAAAETLHALHSQGGHGLRAAKALGIAGLIAALDKFWAEGLPLISARLASWTSTSLLERLQKFLLGEQTYNLWHGRTMVFSWDFIFVAAGALTGMRVCATLLVSATLCWGVFLPILQHKGLVSQQAGFREAVQWTLWAGTACMVTGGILSFFLQWRTLLRAFRSLKETFVRRRGQIEDEIEAIETPMSWFVIGQLISMVALVWLAYVSFEMPWWESVLAVILSFLLAVVACRVTGETDTTPIGAMGKVTQLTFGLLHPGNMNVNLMAANITAGSAASAADLLTDLKSGYLLGANPRKQFLAQFSGIFVGTLITVTAFSFLTKDPSVIGGSQFPAPAAQAWAAVAKALSQGFKALHPVKQYSILWGGIVGIVLTLLQVLFPKKAKYIPSAAAAGLAWVFHWYYSLLFFLGAVAGELFKLWNRKAAEELTFPIASGIIAGGSLMGVLLVFLEIFHKSH